MSHEKNTYCASLILVATTADGGSPNSSWSCLLACHMTPCSSLPSRRFSFLFISCSSANCSLLTLRNHCPHAFTRARWPMKCCASAMGFWNGQRRRRKEEPATCPNRLTSSPLPSLIASSSLTKRADWVCCVISAAVVVGKQLLADCVLLVRSNI